MAGQSFVQIAADSTGKKLDTWIVLGSGGAEVHREAFILTFPDASIGSVTATSVGGNTMLHVASLLSAGVKAEQAGTWNVNQLTSILSSVGVSASIVSPLNSDRVKIIPTDNNGNPAVVLSQDPAVTSFGLVVRPYPGANVQSAGVAQWFGSIAPTVGQKAMASSLPVAIASDQSTLNVSNVSSVGSVLVLQGTSPWVTSGGPGGAGVSLTSAAGLQTNYPAGITYPQTMQIGATSAGVGINLNSAGASFVAPVVSAGVFAEQAGSWTVAATQSGTWNINNVTAIVSSVGVSATIVGQPIAVSQSGTWTVQQGGAPWSVTNATSVGTHNVVPQSSLGRALEFAIIQQSAVGSTEIVAADASNRIKVVSYALVSQPDNYLHWRSNTTPISGPMVMAASSGVSFAGSYPSIGIQTAVNQALNLFATATGSVGGHVAFYREP